MPDGSVVYPSAGSAAEEDVRPERTAAGSGDAESALGFRSGSRRRGDPPALPGEPDPHKVLREINGYVTGHPEQHLDGFDKLKDDGSTTCASWIYCGVYPAPDQNLAAKKEADPPGVNNSERNWGWAWPANRRVLYNRASADLKGQPWSERKRWVWWDGKEWTGYDTPDFAKTKAPSAPGNMKKTGLDALSGTEPFIMIPDGRGWLYNPSGLLDGPLPTHYEPAESVVRNPLYRQQSSPVYKYWKRDDNALAAIADPKYPYVITTYRLTEHYLSGVMSRWNPWLTELMPELFIELSARAGRRKGNQEHRLGSDQHAALAIKAKALVTRTAPSLPNGESSGASGRDAVALGLGGCRHRRRGEQPFVHGGRPERDDSRGKGLCMQRRKSVMGGGEAGRRGSSHCESSRAKRGIGPSDVRSRSRISDSGPISRYARNDSPDSARLTRRAGGVRA